MTKHRRANRGHGTCRWVAWIEIVEKQEGKCRHCSHQYPHPLMLTIDHIRPLARGGNNKPRNLHGLCYECNQRKANRHWEEFHKNDVPPVIPSEQRFYPKDQKLERDPGCRYRGSWAMRSGIPRPPVTAKIFLEPLDT